MRIIPEKYNWNGALAKRMGAPPGVCWHNAAASRCTQQDIHRWHLARGWRGIAYHFFIRKDGRIIQGRPEWAVGGHAFGHGTWLGVCCEGNFDKEQMGKAQLDACIELQQYLTKKYGRGLRVKGHRELPNNATSCPGKYFPLGRVKDAASEPKVDVIRLKKAMLAYAKKAKPPIAVPPEFIVNENWKSGAQTLAWRVSGRVHEKNKSVPQSAKPSLALYRALT